MATSLTPPPLAPKSVDEESWNHVKTAFDLTMSGSGLNHERFMIAYQAAYDCFASTSRVPRSDGKNTELLSENRSPPDLYTKIEEYFGPGCFDEWREKAEILDSEDLLGYWTSQWRIYHSAATEADRICTYLNLHWVKRLRDEGRRDVYPIYQLALLAWNKYFLLPLQQHDRRLTRALVGLARRHHQGETIDVGLMKSVLSSLVSLGINNENLQLISLDIYKENFETEFLEDAEEHLRRVLDRLAFEPQSADEYLDLMMACFKEEKEYVSGAKEYIHPTTEEKLKQRCELTFLGEREQARWEVAGGSSVLEPKPQLAEPDRWL
ncbi:ubiquitin ligase (cullin) of SCF [Marasmius crinis-equi]|uniref:Ubiquitin ligase (Cullin) of SCF n=1 Tax=Marasmius crinis-equi TaxID=585013 RepID=A0ABR3EK14_9AGAR